AARTECPTLASSVTRARPTKPDAPVTRMRVTICLEQSDSTRAIIDAAPAPWQACRPGAGAVFYRCRCGPPAIRSREPGSATSNGQTDAIQSGATAGPLLRWARDIGPQQEAKGQLWNTGQEWLVQRDPG